MSYSCITRRKIINELVPLIVIVDQFDKYPIITPKLTDYVFLQRDLTNSYKLSEEGIKR